jgi:hypothetical protein
MRGMWLLLLVILAGCSGSDIPANVLSPSKMNDVLWDMLQADELSSYELQKDSSLTINHTAQYYQSIFAAHKITRQQFQASLKFYQNHPPLFKPVVQALQRKAENIRAPLDKAKVE